MPEVQLLNSAGKAITSVERWFDLAPPKRGAKHWKDGRSAKELAKAWFRHGSPAVPEEVVQLFRGNEVTRDLMIEVASVEKITPIDDCRGDHRNHDMILIGRTGGQRVLVGVEAKADEAFSDRAGDYLRRRLRKCPSTGVSKRLRELARALFGRDLDDEIGQLRYQLLTALAGILIEAKIQQAAMAILLVHEFVTPCTQDRRIADNTADLDGFVRALGYQGIKPGQIIGPFSVPGGKFVPGNILICIGKVSVCVGPAHRSHS
jgi:hypothetical protein